MVTILSDADPAVVTLAAALQRYNEKHPAATCAIYRYNPAAIRIKIVDPAFHGQSKGDRHDYALGFFEDVPEDVLEELTMLLCLAPGERGLMEAVFETPPPSYC